MSGTAPETTSKSRGLNLRARNGTSVTFLGSIAAWPSTNHVLAGGTLVADGTLMRRRAVAVLLASLSACDLYFEASGENPPDGGPDKPVEVVRIVDEAPGPNCEFGGQATLRGLDVNSNGVLDEDEVTSIAYACNSPTVLTRTEAEPPGANCFAGGEATHSGADTNSNGLLDDAEVQSTRYRCNSTFIHGDVVIHEPEDLDQLAYITLITGSLTINS